MDKAARLLAEADQLRSFGAALNFAPWREVFDDIADELVAAANDNRSDRPEQPSS